MFLGDANGLSSQFRSSLLSAKGTFLCKPRVQRRESANVAEPWETEPDRIQSPNGAALTAMSFHSQPRSFTRAYAGTSN